jgi:hypothetical protein
MTSADTAVWLARHGLNCDRGRDHMRCHGVNPRQIGLTGSVKIDELLVIFDPNGRLTSVEIFRAKVTGPEAKTLMKNARKLLSQSLGSPTRWEEGRLLEYRFDDYVARIATARLSSGFAMSEMYSAKIASRERPASLALVSSFSVQ